MSAGSGILEGAANFATSFLSGGLRMGKSFAFHGASGTGARHHMPMPCDGMRKVPLLLDRGCGSLGRDARHARCLTAGVCTGCRGGFKSTRFVGNVLKCGCRRSEFGDLRIRHGNLLLSTSRGVGLTLKSTVAATKKCGG